MLKRLWCKLIGSSCKWETIRREEIIWESGFGGRREGTRYIQQCKTCGMVVKRDLV